MGRISLYQLFCITIFYQLGTTVVFGFAAGAGRDSWLVILLSTFIGAIIVALYTVIMRLNPGLTLVEWYPAQLGPWIGIPIAWLYPLLALYDVGRILADLQFAVSTTLLPNTPPLVFLGLTMFVIVVGLLYGIEVLGRIGELIFPILLTLFVIQLILLLGSGVINLDNLQPFLANGWEVIWGEIWPLGLTQTFAQSLELAMIWALTKQTGRIIKPTLIATFLSGMLIMSLNILAITVLGEGLFQQSMYPMYLLIQQISIGEFIENLHAISVLQFTTTAILKLYIHAFVAVYAIQQLLFLRNHHIIIIVVAIIGIYMGMTMATSAQEHIYVGTDIFPYNLWIPLLFVFPSILLIVSIIRKIWSKKKVKRSFRI
ncbi:GerAB/ArcD/ProY family transporter [Halalkalibacter lacteus]|uniref:GerAB/ArcD/ProY family transporter n=1 Tax=Halalkalibacter lacteus TaxID=3090663 RepID=UPI002FC94C9E